MNDDQLEGYRAIIRPTLSLLFSMAFIAGVILGEIPEKYLVYATLGILVFWFGERGFKSFGNLLKASVVPPVPPTAPGIVRPTRPAMAPAPPEEIEPPPEPFPVSAFHHEVMLEVEPRYGEVNPATIAYEARDKGMVTKCDHISWAQDYWSYLVSLYRDAFSHIWGYSYEEAREKVADPGCPCCSTCPEGCGGHTNLESKARHLGMGYYAILLEVKRFLRKQQDLDELAQAPIDWKAKLGPQHQTLYYLGALASEILKYA